jgi:[acyl-carrier-protein] S-malonyltransferase
MAGHSLGEYTALVCASSLSLIDAVQVVAKRGALMQNAVPDGIGMMAAILGMEDSDVDTLCADTRKALGNNMVVASANYNTKGQVVISGHKPAVEKAMELAKTRGAKRAIALPVSVPSHCALMQEASFDLAKILAPMKMPSIPVLHNIDGKACYTVQEIKAALVAQLYEPVQWVKTMRNMLSYGIYIFYECGPGNVLSGLNKRIDPSIICESLSREATLCP